MQIAGRRISAFDAHPVGAGCQAIVNHGGSLEMAYVRFQNIVTTRSIAAWGFQSDQAMCFGGGKPQIDDQVLDRQAVNFIFDMPQPRKKLVALFRRDTFRLVREIRGDVAIGQYNLPRGQGRFDLALCLETVSGVNEGREVRVDGFKRPEIAIEITAGEFAEARIVARESDALDRESPRFERMGKQIQLRALSGAVNSFERD